MTSVLVSELEILHFFIRNEIDFTFLNFKYLNKFEFKYEILYLLKAEDDYLSLISDFRTKKNF